MNEMLVRARRGAYLTLAAALSVGCYTTQLRSGQPAAAPGIEYDERWHHGLVWGIAELSGPYNMARVCPQGWAVIKTETSFLNGIVSVVTSGIYSPQSVTVQCAVVPAGAPVAPPSALPLEPVQGPAVLSSSP